MGEVGTSLIRFSIAASLSKAIVPPPKPLTIEQEDEQTADGRCDKEGDLWFFLGSDDMIGFSHVSCGKAYRKWIQTHVDPVKMSRV